MSEGKEFAQLPNEETLSDDDLLLIGSNGTSTFKKTTLQKLREWLFPDNEEPEDTVSELDKLHPIGSMYISVNQTSPSVLFGGTWTEVKGCYLYCGEGSKVGEKDGSSEITIKEENLPPHSHGMDGHSHSITVENTSAMTTYSSGSHTHSGTYTKDTASGTAKGRYSAAGTTVGKNFVQAAGEHTHSIPAHSHQVTCETSGNGNTHSVGSGVAISINPIRYNVFAWVRVS